MLSDGMLKLLFAEAERVSLQEMCGLLFAEPAVFVSMRNVADDPARTFKIDMDEYLATVAAFHGQHPWAVVHSHPAAPAAPSVEDCRLMDACELSGTALAMVIVGLNPRQVKAYRREGHVYRCLWAQEPS